jgi:hypothetical protein
MNKTMTYSDFIFRPFILLSLVMISLSLKAQEKAISPEVLINGTFLGETTPLRDLPVLTEAEMLMKSEKEDQEIPASIIDLILLPARHCPKARMKLGSVKWARTATHARRFRI